MLRHESFVVVDLMIGQMQDTLTKHIGSRHLPFGWRSDAMSVEEYERLPLVTSCYTPSSPTDPRYAGRMPGQGSSSKETRAGLETSHTSQTHTKGSHSPPGEVRLYVLRLVVRVVFPRLLLTPPPTQPCLLRLLL
jgi:hypothetical protein